MEIISQKPDLVRRPHFAGSFYPADPAELSAQLDKKIADSKRPQSARGDVGAIVTSTTVDTLFGDGPLGAIRSLNRKKYSTVAVVAAAQQGFFDHAAIFEGGAYETPLGRVFVDLKITEKMANTLPKVVFSGNGHAGGKEAEYAIEMILPYLQRLLGDFRLIPVVLGNESTELAVAAGEVLAANLDGEQSLIVGCSELIFGDDVSLAKINSISEAITKMDWRLLSDRIESVGVAGVGPMISTMYAGKRLGARRAEALVNASSHGQAMSVVLMREQ